MTTSLRLPWQQLWPLLPVPAPGPAALPPKPPLLLQRLTLLALTSLLVLLLLSQWVMFLQLHAMDLQQLMLQQ